MSNLYSAQAEEKRKQFNRLINSCNMVLMNNIPEVDESVWDNWQDKSPMGNDEEVYQWFAVGDSDAEFLKNHNQYVTYSDMLDTYFLAITHFGTSWDYTSMVDDFNDMYVGLDELDAEKEVA